MRGSTWTTAAEASDVILSGGEAGARNPTSASSVAVVEGISN